MTGTRAKCTSKDAVKRNVTFGPTADGGEGNKKFFTSLEASSIELKDLKTDTFDKFVVGKEYQIDFTLIGPKP